jgi:predicted acyltransferase
MTLSKEERLLSLDVFRGIIMVLLMLESTGMYEHLQTLTQWSIWMQFFHHPWNGLRFWDLIQPGFMFIAGTAMAFSLTKQRANGISWNQSFIRMLKRCGWLFFWGVLDYAVRPGGLSFELWDVLTQLSFTLMVAFLIFNWRIEWQIGCSIGLLLLTEVLYRFTNIPGFDEPFVDQHNFGNWMDLLLMNKINRDGWVAINCIPTAAHTIWGAIAGKILLGNHEVSVKIKFLIVSAILLLLLGYGMDITVTPMIKRIATSSFTLASGGWCLMVLAILYYWIDVTQHRHYIWFFTMVGMNSLFIYLFFEIVGHRWFNGYVTAISDGLLSILRFPRPGWGVISSAIIFFLEWNLCYFLYRKKIFFKV